MNIKIKVKIKNLYKIKTIKYILYNKILIY